MYFKNCTYFPVINTVSMKLLVDPSARKMDNSSLRISHTLMVRRTVIVMTMHLS
jgi:hypothetical protein